jgi:hypothetical protein
MSEPIPATGAWYGLSAIFKDQNREFDWWADEVRSEGGLACPIDGEPLTTGPSTDAGADVTRFCKFCGWRAPRDVVVPRKGTRMGRTG